MQNSLIFDIASAQKSKFLKRNKNVFSTNLFWFLLLNICGHISGAGCQVQACGEQGNALGGDRGVGGWMGGLEVATLRRFMKFIFKVIQYLRERFHACAVGETFHGEAQYTTQPCKFNFFNKYIAEHITPCLQRLVIPKSRVIEK